ncbi:YdeI/OmpD-associated family protein [Nocardioides rubriscoriae]|uniref:YdeI/OmpD-associated family protein n=1 Tax=Nocardioides rubriscoriae TaxID=642762 RepID=UPI0011DF1B47|nr:YdeI/OmpD-associated family protein [Nocardioides rubriscoriae]
MGDPTVEFDAALEPMAWGRNVYTIIRVPAELADAARDASTRRVAGTLEDLAVNVGLNRADVIEDTFVYAGAGLQRRLGLGAGAVVRCALAPVDPDLIPVPDDVAEALERNGRRDAFERRSAPDRRRLLVPVDNAVRPATRAQRIAALVEALPAD